MWRREASEARNYAESVIDIGEAHEFPVWAAAGSCLQGAAIAATGAVDDGLARFEAAMDQYRALKTPPVFWPSLLNLHAAVLGLAGRPADGLARIDEALRVVAELPEPQMMSSELLLLKGTLLLASSNDATEAEVWFERAVRRADQLEAPMFQLRASTALARLWCAGNTEPARTLLTTAYERLTEGFTTADLIDARQLLDDLTATRAEASAGVQAVVGLAGIEPATSSLSGMRSNRLSYSPGEPPSVAKVCGHALGRYSVVSSSVMVSSMPPKSSANML